MYHADKETEVQKLVRHSLESTQIIRGKEQGLVFGNLLVESVFLALHCAAFLTPPNEAVSPRFVFLKV